MCIHHNQSSQPEDGFSPLGHKVGTILHACYIILLLLVFLLLMMKMIMMAINVGLRKHFCSRLFHGSYYFLQEVGDGIRASGVPREEIFVVSKLWNTKHHPDDVEVACRQTLSDLGIFEIHSYGISIFMFHVITFLGLDYVDLYLIHFPQAYQRGDDFTPKKEDGSYLFDESIHPTDCWLEMEKLVAKGLVKSIGVSNFNSEQIEDILRRGTIKPVTNQVYLRC